MLLILQHKFVGYKTQAQNLKLNRQKEEELSEREVHRKKNEQKKNTSFLL